MEIAPSLSPSAHGELKITDVDKHYLKNGRARLVRLSRGFTGLDAGTYDSLLSAGQYVQVMEQRQGIRPACIEEIALHKGHIDNDDCHRNGAEMKNAEYGHYLMQVAQTM